MSKEAISSSNRKVERVRESSADCSILPTYEDSLFLRQNDYWIIRYHGRTSLLKSTRGLHCLAVLLHDPGREFHVRDLLSGPMDASMPAAAVLDERSRRGPHTSIPTLDAQAKAECKRRLNELRQDLNEAERFNDPQRKTEAKNELQAITDYLASAVGLGGRNRRASSDAERARSAVTKCIKNAIHKICEANPSLGYHLTERIKTGYFCSYNPHPERPVDWKF
jgi:non-specific serine/threonine protein kinase